MIKIGVKNKFKASIKMQIIEMRDLLSLQEMIWPIKLNSLNSS